MIENQLITLLESQGLTNTLLAIMFPYIYELKKNLKNLWRLVKNPVFRVCEV